jgi:NAD(P)-dependent dehydrogenase (short-subunit alcohol dehydrogenase family)
VAEQRNIFITGVGSGLGKALTRLFIEKEFRVYGLLRDMNQARKLAGRNFIPVLADVSEDSCEGAIFDAVRDQPVHLLINNAGNSGTSHQLETIRTSDMLSVFNTHCLGVMRVTRALMGNLLAADKPVVLNINSRMGSVAGQYSGEYSHLRMTYEYRIAKAAQNMLSACIKNEMGEQIEIYQVHPGRMKTGTGQVDADLEPEEAALNIYNLWINKKLREGEGIIDSETGGILPW